MGEVRDTTTDPLLSGPASDREMMRRVREKDWSRTPLGPMERWPHALRVAVSMCLHTRIPMFIWWGPDLVNIYNDGYAPILGARHPHALGGSAPRIWSEVWSTLEGQVEAVMQRGEATWNERVPLRVERHGYPEVAYFTWSYSPIPDDAGGIGGLLATVIEETERIRAEQELADTRRRLDSALIAGEVGTFEWDVQADLLRGDQNFARIFSIQLDATGAAPLGTYLAALHPGDRARVNAKVEHALRTGEDYEAEYRIIGQDHTRWVIARGKVEHDEAGRVVRFPGVVLDITDRMQVAEALRRSEARYRTLFGSIDEGFCVVQMIFDEEGQPIDGRYLEVNPAFEKNTGVAGAAGRTLRETVPNLESFWLDVLGRVAATGEPVRLTEHAESLGRWFDLYALRVGEPDEQTVAVLFSDITARRHAEEERERLLRALQVERSRLEYVFQRAPSFLAVVRGPEHVFELANDAYFQLVGQRELLHRPVREALPEVVGQGFVAMLDQVLTTGEPVFGREESIQLTRTSGAEPEERFVDFSYLPLIEGDGSRSGVIAHGTDVTDHVLARREVERLLRESEQARSDAERARAEAEAANRAKADFLASMSHELRTPLNAIGGYVDLLDIGVHGILTEPQRDALARVTANQRHLLTLINDVLAFAKLEAGQVDFDLRPIEVSELLASVMPLVDALAHVKGIALSIQGGAPTHRVIGDEERVRQILLNLVGNAIKYTQEGGWVVLTAEQEGEWVDIRVRDNGPGISPDQQQRIFDPFIQVDRRLNRPQEGVGLGLAISRDLALAMGGDLRVESIEGEGSTFILRLPAAA